MQTTGRLFDDIAKLTGGAMGALGGVKQEAEAAIRQRLERILSDMDLVPRDEFDAMADVARAAREEQEALTKKVAALEARLAKLESAPKAAPSKTGTAKAAAKTAKAKTAPTKD
ncbi:accessory factor UbiK family protein [Rhodospirillaceae bacterium KN72]|uniref:Accessory factor UbiK family protein n=1 Tax=Pacificispira spongiicola TaxID=2729598 RepID=A0A7Y0DX66_9PROT|nr:accessory factor UbiK family protein [Pacificispira spongiicola]NMM43258.1 accessory factor UbiK family protein [Pacificispira spongiicola]